ncbi:hypothetical protein GCM10010967_35770 [Dyadobacter beijingensis]|uniref:Uncharacterized protein n=1 Tax=Dyadobacter beijingensis TaxID=365489 RepID=A0ABQ2I4M6_9BACT|nr:hypothetical protein [Dyadobacter beijingensis]GGM98724.1 hypothetical protein GCM10010967_35770 [Dyadobacter beijingensis]
MNIVKKWAGVLLLLAVCAGCRGRSESEGEAEKYLEKLNDNQAIIHASIAGKPFYGAENVFSGQIIMSGDVMNLTLTDQFDGRTIINAAGDKWYAQRPVSVQIDRDGESGSSLKMGKIVDREKLIGEGYMMTKGEIKAIVFEKDKMVFELKGEVAKYSDFEKPDQYLPFEALVVYKKPAISFGDMSEQAIFGSTYSK